MNIITSSYQLNRIRRLPLRPVTLIFIFLLSVFMSGCDKDNDVPGLRQKYLNNGYIHYKLTYRNDSTNVEFSDTYRLFSNYATSEITNYGNSNFVLITRYSSDFQSYIQLDMDVDSTDSSGVPALFGVTYHINKTDKNRNILNFDNTIIYGTSGLNSDSHFSKIKLDTLSKTISGEFYYKKYWADGEILEIQGDFEAQLYKFLN